MSARNSCFCLLLGLAAVVLGGCSPQVTEARKRFFWPPPPAEARIEYVDYYFSDEDLSRGVDKRFEEMIFGKPHPIRMFTEPYSVASNGKGQVFVTDFSGTKVMVMDLVKHELRELVKTAGEPQKVLCDRKGDIWVLDAGRKRIHHFTADEVEVAKLSLDNKVTRPASIAVDRERNRLYVSDTPQHQVRAYDLEGTPLFTIGKRGKGDGEFNFPTDLALAADGRLVVLDAMNARVQVFTPEGAFVRSFGERGTMPGSFSIPKGLTVSPTGLVYVTDVRLSKVVVFNLEGEYLINFGGREVFDGTRIVPGGFYFPTGIDADPNEALWIADMLNNTVYHYQYLTPEYLAKHPIKPGEAFVPVQVPDAAQSQEDGSGKGAPGDGFMAPLNRQ